MEKHFKICFNIVLFFYFMCNLCEGTKKSWMSTTSGNGLKDWFAGNEDLVGSVKSCQPSGGIEINHLKAQTTYWRKSL